MNKVMLSVCIMLFLIVGGTRILRLLDSNYEKSAWRQLSGGDLEEASKFDPAMIANLPEPAKRFFQFSIATETPLKPVVEISMDGTLNLGTIDAPNSMNMKAEQIIAPRGFVWRVMATADGTRLSGSDGFIDGKSWSRFWIKDFIPVARTGGTTDHAKASFGRFVAETLIWSPASLLPRDGVVWSRLSDTAARVTVTSRALVQSVDLTVNDRGQPEKIVFVRWSDANPRNTYQSQPFGGYLTEFKEFDGYRLPTRVIAGNHFETDEYFPFFDITVSKVTFQSTK